MVKVKQQFFKTAGGSGIDSGFSLSVNCNRVFVTGQVEAPVAYDFNGTPKPLKGNNDIFVAGLDHCGTQKFFKTAGGLGLDFGNSITSNDCGTFLTGLLQGDTASDFNGTEFNVTGAEEIFVAGLDNCGKQNFFVTAGNNDSFGYQIVHDSKCLYITGYVIGTGTYDFNRVLHPLKGSDDIVVAGLDHCGNQKFFVTAGGVLRDQGNSITVNKKGVFVTGYIQSPGVTAFDGSSISTYGAFDIFVAGLNKCGNQIFFKHAGVGTTGSGRGNSITSDCHNIFVTGYISGASGTIGTNFAGQPVDIIGNDDIFVAGLDTCGNQKFFVTAGSFMGDVGLSITTNDKGVFVTGFVRGPNATDFKHKPIKTYGNHDIFVAGLTKCGTQKFFVTAGSSGTDRGLSITTNDEGIFVTGFVGGPTATDFCGKLIPNLQGGDGDIFVAKLDFCGRQQFFLTAGGNQFDQGNQIVVRGNEIYVTGSMGGTAGVNFKNCPVTTLRGNGDIFVARLDDLCHKKCSAKK